MTPADLKKHRELPDDQAFEIACAVHRRDLCGPDGESVQDHENAEAWIEFQFFAESEPMHDAISHTIENHPSVLPSTLQQMADDSHYFTRIRTLANRIKRRRANLRGASASDP